MENWENSAIACDNLLPPHADFSEEELSLGGKWRFLGLNQGDAMPEGWTAPDFHDRKWNRIGVPGTWEAAEELDLKSCEVGLYRRSFILSREVGSRQIVLRFAALSDSAVLWVNGTYIGKAAGMDMPCEFDITAAIRPEKNIICLLLRRENGVRIHRHMGLPGDVSLYSLPARALTALTAETRWEEDGTPLLHIALETRNCDGFTARIALLDDNAVVGYRESRITGDHTEADLPCTDVSLWCSDQPKLYRIAVILWDGVAVYHTRELTVGFRRVERQDGILLLNGQPEKFFAAEYSPIDPRNGCFLSPEEMEARLTALRNHHINAIFLNSSAPDRFYALCDRLGLYVLDGSAEQNRRHADTFGCHPSIIAWNAASDHPNILDMAQIALITDSAATDRKTVLLSPLDSNVNPEPLIRKIRETPHILGAVFSDAPSRLRELKALLQPVLFSWEDGNLTVTNLSRFRSTAPYECRYALTRDGETVVTKVLDLEIEPGQTRSVFLETQYDIYRSGRYYLTAAYVHPESGHVFASGQWEAGYLHHIFDENPGGSIREDQGSLLLRSGNAAYTVTRTTGAVEQITHNDRPLFTDGAWNIYSADAEKPSGFLRSDEWERLTVGRKKLKPSVLEVDHMTRTVSASYKLGSGLIQNYRLYADGSMSWELRLRTGRTAPALLGVCMPLDQKLDRFRWFGLGPDDTSPDRNAGCFYGIHSQKASTETSGAKEPVYRLTVTDDTGFGLMVRSEDGLRASLRQAENANHLRLELPARELKPHTTYTFSFTLQPVQE